MKHIVILLLLAVIIICGAACKNPRPAEAKQYADTIVRVNETITAYATAWGDTLKTTDNTGMLKKIRTSMEDYIDQSIAMLRAMNAPGQGGDNMKKEELVFLDMEKTVAERGLQPFENLTPASTQQEKQTAYDSLSNTGQREAEETYRLKKQQGQYARDNNVDALYRKPG